LSSVTLNYLQSYLIIVVHLQLKLTITFAQHMYIYILFNITK